MTILSLTNVVGWLASTSPNAWTFVGGVVGAVAVLIPGLLKAKTEGATAESSILTGLINTQATHIAKLEARVSFLEAQLQRAGLPIYSEVEPH